MGLFSGFFFFRIGCCAGSPYLGCACFSSCPVGVFQSGNAVACGAQDGVRTRGFGRARYNFCSVQALCRGLLTGGAPREDLFRIAASWWQEC